MRDSEEGLTKVERRLLSELRAFRATMPAEPLAGAGPQSQSRQRGPRSRAKERHGRLQQIQNTAVAGALLAVLVLILVHTLSSPTPTLAATPKPLAYHTPLPGAPSGRQELLNLAAAAARQRTARTNHPRYAYTKTRGWYLDSRIGAGSTTSAVVPSTTESWLAPDGSGRMRTVAEEPGDHRYVDDFKLAGGHALLRLSRDEAVLARELARGHPRSDGPVERFVALSDLANRQPIPAAVESVILRLLASTPGLINSGTVTDRAGRPGVAVSLDSAYTGLPNRYTWTFDRHTGALLGEEDMLIGNTGKLNVRRGAVVSYTTFLPSGWVANTSSQRRSPPRWRS
ncbi:MAG TPA: CU044_5270 family protein [Solirubrobacteraceae bacterium]